MHLTALTSLLLGVTVMACVGALSATRVEANSNRGEAPFVAEGGDISDPFELEQAEVCALRSQNTPWVIT